MSNEITLNDSRHSGCACMHNYVAVDGALY